MQCDWLLNALRPADPSGTGLGGQRLPLLGSTYGNTVHPKTLLQPLPELVGCFCLYFCLSG